MRWELVQRIKRYGAKRITCFRISEKTVVGGLWRLLRVFNHLRNDGCLGWSGRRKRGRLSRLGLRRLRLLRSNFKRSRTLRTFDFFSTILGRDAEHLFAARATNFDFVSHCNLRLLPFSSTGDLSDSWVFDLCLSYFSAWQVCDLLPLHENRMQTHVVSFLMTSLLKSDRGLQISCDPLFCAWPVAFSFVLVLPHPKLPVAVI